MFCNECPIDVVSELQTKPLTVMDGSLASKLTKFKFTVLTKHKTLKNMLEKTAQTKI